MAAPHVLGAASLLLAQDPTLSATELKESLLAGTDPIESLRGRTVTGGRLNAFNSLSELAPPSEIVGTEGDDVLVVTNRQDSILGLGGDDIIQALRGNDSASGGDDDDLIDAGDGNDELNGGSDDDTLIGIYPLSPDATQLGLALEKLIP